jgi:hypothetical protein
MDPVAAITCSQHLSIFCHHHREIVAALYLRCAWHIGYLMELRDKLQGF